MVLSLVWVKEIVFVCVLTRISITYTIYIQTWVQMYKCPNVNNINNIHPRNSDGRRLGNSNNKDEDNSQRINNNVNNGNTFLSK